VLSIDIYKEYATESIHVFLIHLLEPLDRIPDMMTDREH
jgi:hypothetical protein